ncbi:hypothetical protein GBF38_015478 [Nibea albiflora]|uniref:Uncharacterized protein n=1 Tax=Nibea albiflora TaxID=240163 RepID=A0ACB7EML3_NIBAL|nr:hypothetical protein GBF38_015478 [Nibea albiflora]
MKTSSADFMDKMTNVERPKGTDGKKERVNKEEDARYLTGVLVIVSTSSTPLVLLFFISSWNETHRT